MKLVNFEVTSEVELYGLGEVWDLHNCADFSGLALVPEEGAAILQWEIIPQQNPGPWGFSAVNPAQSCAIRFDGVTALWVTRVDQDGEMADPSNSRTLDGVSFVVPASSTPKDVIEHGYRIPASSKEGHLLFRFMDGFNIEIAASEATLKAGSRRLKET